MNLDEIKIDNAEETLKNILFILQNNWEDCQEAFKIDSKVGNSYNVCEAGGFFKDVLEEIQECLPEEIVFDLTIPDCN